MSVVQQLAERYREIIPELDRFMDYATRPPRSVAWRNPLAVSKDELRAWMTQHCPEAEALGWNEDAWRLPSGARPGLWPIYLAGWVYVQDETSLLAGTMLGAQPNERILDLCAAPGGKSVRAATLMNDSGTLIANDMNGGRLVALRRAFERMLITCAAVTHGNGLKYPMDEGGFDRVIADVPCTCEGTSRKQRLRPVNASDNFRSSINQTQKGLLRRALKLCKPGGVVLYATCTYDPAENEMVIDAARVAADFDIEPLELHASITHSPGVTRWHNKRLRDDLVNAVRLYPHQNDSGGFFFACLRKL